MHKAFGVFFCSRRTLPPGVVDGIFSVEQDLGDGEEGIAVLEELFQDGGKRFRSVLGGVVEQHDGAGLHLGGHPLGDLRGGEVLPVQTITTMKALGTQ